MRRLIGLNRPSVSSMALQFTILTAARTDETVGAPWDEFDLEAKQWTVPAERMKGGREHKVPLSDAAVAIVEAMKKVRTSRYVFPGWKRGETLSDMAMLQCLRGFGLKDEKGRSVTVHGFRSSFKDWASEQRAPAFADHLSEMALAHIEGDKARAAYARSDLLEKRRELMQAWADYCTDKKAAAKPARAGTRRRKAA
jgi:integrase